MSAFQSVESLEQAALRLHPDARVKLTHALVKSLANLPEAEIAELWVAEAERRDLEMDSGQVAGISGAEVFKRLRARLRACRPGFRGGVPQGAAFPRLGRR